MISVKEISLKKFEKAAFGYKPDEVDEFLKDIAADLQQLQRGKEDCEKKIDVLADKVREYMKDEDALKDALLGAQRSGRQVMETAQLTADKILLEANEQADKIVGQTKIQLEREKNGLLAMQKEVSEFKAKLLGLYKNHLDLITAMPDADYEIENVAEEISSTIADITEDEPDSVQQRTSEKAPFSRPNSAESRYSDLKFGNNSK